MLCYAMQKLSNLISDPIAAQCIRQPSLVHSALLQGLQASIYLPTRILGSLGVVPSCLLACFQLLEIVTAGRHVTSRLVKALCKLRCVSRTRSTCLLAVAASLAVVEASVHGLGVSVGRVLLVGLVVVGLGWSGFLS